MKKNIKNLMNIKTASDLKFYNEFFAETMHQESYFFTRDTMKFFGDTMKNYKIKLTDNFIELHRKKPVKFGNQDIAYFNYNDFQKAVI
tara:strand:- start:1409 stop:1672 length:264 start_codon:yes stop_codon:yes gene_type:complete